MHYSMGKFRMTLLVKISLPTKSVWGSMHAGPSCTCMGGWCHKILTKLSFSVFLFSDLISNITCKLQNHILLLTKRVWCLVHAGPSCTCRVVSQDPDQNEQRCNFLSFLLSDLISNITCKLPNHILLRSSRQCGETIQYSVPQQTILCSDVREIPSQ